MNCGTKKPLCVLAPGRPVVAMAMISGDGANSAVNLNLNSTSLRLRLASLLGDPLIEYAEEREGVSGAAAPLVVWLLAFSLASVGNVGYAIYLLQTNNTWSRYAWVSWADLLGKFRNVRRSVFFFCEVRRSTPELLTSCRLTRAPKYIAALQKSCCAFLW